MLLDVMSEVYPIDSRCHIAYRFYNDRPDGIMRIQFQYAPKRLEDRLRAQALITESIGRYIQPEHQQTANADWERYLPLQNLITISVDDPEGYRGACHRHSPEQQLYLAEKDASDGLVPGTISRGIWTVTISLHAIVTDNCTYKLKVWKSGEDECAG